MRGIEYIIVVGWILFGTYIEVLVMIAADLWSGVRKAKARGEVRTSYGYKKTIDKIARYYNALIALTAIDLMQMACTWYLTVYYDWSIPIIPIVTIIGAIGISLVEVKSIYEKAEDKVKGEYKDVAILAAEIAKHTSEPSELLAAAAEYLQKKKEESNDGK